jgi:hypothetical protein
MAYRPGYKPLLPHHREEQSSEQPKPKRAIRADVPEIRRVIAEIKRKFPWLADTGEAGNANLSKIFSWLQDNDAADGWTQHNVEIAVQVLLPELESDRDYVPPQPPLPPALPKPELEKLEPWQLPLTATKQQLRNADPKALKGYLARAREAQKK